MKSETRAMKAISIPTMLMASETPCDAPEAAASMTFACSCSIFTLTAPAVAGSSISGRRSLAMTIVAGAAMTDAVMRYSAGTPIAA